MAYFTNRNCTPVYVPVRNALIQNGVHAFAKIAHNLSDNEISDLRRLLENTPEADVDPLPRHRIPDSELSTKFNEAIYNSDVTLAASIGDEIDRRFGTA
tara:strand:+ start:466 stop:762 length:297 start_codon:yes stop_codon:yes gene_type:complete